MNNKGRWALGLGVLTLALAASPAAAQTTANGPYYASPSWDQTLPSSTRFIVLSNMASAAVLDRETGLVWQRSAGSAQEVFVNASKTCLSSTTGNRFGWRLPTVNELASLFDPSQTTPPFLPSGHPFTDLPTKTATFWTATEAADSTSSHFCVLYDNSSIFTGVSISCVAGDVVSLIPWCVRGGLLASPQ